MDSPARAPEGYAPFRADMKQRKRFYGIFAGDYTPTGYSPESFIDGR